MYGPVPFLWNEFHEAIEDRVQGSPALEERVPRMYQEEGIDDQHLTADGVYDVELPEVTVDEPGLLINDPGNFDDLV